MQNQFTSQNKGFSRTSKVANNAVQIHMLSSQFYKFRKPTLGAKITQRWSPQQYRPTKGRRSILTFVQH